MRRIFALCVFAILLGGTASVPLGGVASAQQAVRRGLAPPLAEALQSLRPGAQWAIIGDEVRWLDAVQTRPTDAEIAAEISRIDALPADPLSVAAFIGRWTNTEYSNLMKARATAVQNNSAGMTMVRQWDMAVAKGVVDMTTQAAKDFKASLVSAGILTQARADVIFQ